MCHSDSEPDDDIITIAEKKFAISTGTKPTNNNKQTKRASTTHQKMINDSSKIFEMSLATDGVAEFGDWGRWHERRL